MDDLDHNNEYAPPYAYAALAAVCVFALYALTLAPTTAFWDTSEYIATAHIMGIPHPPGNPLFVVLARSWDVLLTPLGLPVGVRINLFSATMSALAHGCWFLLVHRVLVVFSPSRLFALTGSAVAVLCSATAFTVWNQSNVNEKVYTVSLFTIALLSWLVLRWRDRSGSRGSDRILILIVFLLALSVGNHLMAFLAAPAILVFVLVTRYRVLLDWRIYVLGCVAGLLGLSVHLFLPIRAGMNPVINQANPRCDLLGSAFVSVATLGRAGCPALSESLARKQYGKPSMFVDPITAPQQQLPRSPGLLGAQIANYVQYFDWQWARSVAGNRNWFGGMRPLITLLFIMLGCYGALQHKRHDFGSFLFFAVLFATLSSGLMFYLNFKYGYSSPWADAAHALTEVRERDYFFVVSFSLWGLWAGIGLASLWLRYSKPVVLVLALIPMIANWTWASRAGDYVSRDWSYNLLMSVEPYGVLVTSGDNDTFPLWYLQEVEGIRQDVTVIVMSYLNTGWYAKQLRDLTQPCGPRAAPASDRTRIICQRPFVAPNGTTVYATSSHTADSPTTGGAEPMHVPSHSILDLSDAQIDTMSLTAFYSPAAVFQAGELRTNIAAGTEILPADIFLAQIIKSSIGDRPIYFALTSPSYGTLDLQDHLVMHGLAYKLVNGDVHADPSNGRFELPTGGARIPRFVDAPVTEELFSKVFVQHSGFPEKWTHWTDVATENTPLFYSSPIRSVAYSYAVRGDEARAQQLVTLAQTYERLTNVRAADVAAHAHRR